MRDYTLEELKQEALTVPNAIFNAADVLRIFAELEENKVLAESAKVGDAVLKENLMSFETKDLRILAKVLADEGSTVGANLIGKAAEEIDLQTTRASVAELELNFVWRTIQEAHEAFGGESEHPAFVVLKRAIDACEEGDEDGE